MKVSLISLEKIKPNPDNPNPHTPESVATLAANIKEFGLINPIMVRPIIENHKESGKFEVIAGAGRLRAYERLWAEARSNKQTQRWAEIPAVVINDQTEFGAWGRRLSENKLRSFNWRAECVCFARMRAEGRDWKGIAEVFGLKSQEDVVRRIALGCVPGIENIELQLKVSFDEATRYLLPLRIETARSPDDGNQRVYDYSEVTSCIDKLVSGELTKEDLPTYSAERRLAIQQAQQDVRLKEIASAELANWKKKLSEKDGEVKAAQAKLTAETRRLQDEATKKAEKLRVDYEQKIKAVTAEIVDARAKIEGAGDEKTELQKRIDELTEDRNLYEGQVIDLENKIAVLREQVELEVAEKVRAEMIDQLREEIQAEKDVEQEREISDSFETLAREQEDVARQQQQIKAEKERLKKKVAELEEEKKRLEVQREKAAQLHDLNGWIKVFNRFCGEFIHMLGVANTHQYWNLMDKPELKQIYSSLSGIGDQLRQIEANFQSRGLLGGQ